MKSPALFVTALVFTTSLTAGCASTWNLGVAASLPPPLLQPPPSELLVLPGTDIYVASSHRDDVYFVDGWWWRPWNGHWYRSERYGRDWSYFADTPHFARSIPDDWRSQYERREWKGGRWDNDGVSRDQMVSQWDRWKREGRWTGDRHRHDDSRRGERSHEDPSARGFEAEEVSHADGDEFTP